MTKNEEGGGESTIMIEKYNNDNDNDDNNNNSIKFYHITIRFFKMTYLFLITHEITGRFLSLFLRYDFDEF